MRNIDSIYSSLYQKLEKYKHGIFLLIITRESPSALYVSTLIPCSFKSDTIVASLFFTSTAVNVLLLPKQHILIGGMPSPKGCAIITMITFALLQVENIRTASRVLSITESFQLGSPLDCNGRLNPYFQLDVLLYSLFPAMAVASSLKETIFGRLFKFM